MSTPENKHLQLQLFSGASITSIMLYKVRYNEQIYYVRKARLEKKSQTRKARAGNVMQTSKCINLQIMN